MPAIERRTLVWQKKSLFRAHMSENNVDSIVAYLLGGGSKNIHRKNLQIVYGKPLIAYAIEVALQTPLS